MTSRNPGRFCQPIVSVVLVLAVAGAGCTRRPASSVRRTAVGSSHQSTTAAPVDWTAVDAVLGRVGDALPGGVHRYGFPRSDLSVSLDGVVLKSGFALGSYAAFVRAGGDVLVMGDLVLTEAEVSQVMAKLQDQGFDVTAVHNHLLREEPKVMYLHYLGHGADAGALARGLRAALESSATPLAPPAVASPGADLGFDPAELDGIIGTKGTTTGGLQKYAIARQETVTMPAGTTGTVSLTPALGVGTVINFQPLDSGRAATTGDFALIGTEVASVTRALRAHDIEVTAIHSHMTEDRPHLYYVHFFGTGQATDLAQGLRAALDRTNAAKQ
jgi:hypothetical protein